MPIKLQALLLIKTGFLYFLDDKLNENEQQQKNEQRMDVELINDCFIFININLILIKRILIAHLANAIARKKMEQKINVKYSYARNRL